MENEWRNSKFRQLIDEMYLSTIEKQIKQIEDAIGKSQIPTIAIQSSAELDGKFEETDACSSAWKYWALGQIMRKGML